MSCSLSRESCEPFSILAISILSNRIGLEQYDVVTKFRYTRLLAKYFTIRVETYQVIHWHIICHRCHPSLP